MMAVSNMTVGYSRSCPILRDVSFSASNGKLTAVLGPNGAGKSTLLKCMCGMLAPTQGRIFIDDIALPGAKPKEVAKKVASVSQLSSSTSLTVFEAVLMGRLPHSGDCPSKSDKDAAANVLSRFGLDYVASKSYLEISGGEQQKAQLARAYVQNASNLLLDEPLNGLDFKSRHATMRMLSDLAHHHGCAVVVVLHDLDMALRYCDRFVVVSNGKVAVKDHASEIDDGVVSALYGMSCKVHALDGCFVVLPDEV